MPSPIRTVLRRFVMPPLVVLAAILMWLEEWLWETLKGLTARMARMPPIPWYEAQLLRLPPYPTMAAFVLPGLFLLPIKIGAVWLIGEGRIVAGICLIGAAKIAGTAIVARSYVLCKPKLMTIHWFARLHDAIFAARNYLYDRVRTMPLYPATRRRLSALRHAVKTWVGSLK